MLACLLFLPFFLPYHLLSSIYPLLLSPISLSSLPPCYPPTFPPGPPVPGNVKDLSNKEGRSGKPDLNGFHSPGIMHKVHILCVTDKLSCCPQSRGWAPSLCAERWGSETKHCSGAQKFTLLPSITFSTGQGFSVACVQLTHQNPSWGSGL